VLQGVSRVTGSREPRGAATGGGGGSASSRGLRITLVGLIGGEILPAHGYRDEGSDWCELLLG
jgi:hypothetical protein